MSATPLAQALGDLDEATTVAVVETKLASGETPLSILEELQAGMETCRGALRRRRVLPVRADLRGRHLQEGLRPPGRGTQGRDPRHPGTLVLGTVKNDIHDFGKDIVATVMSSNGIRVIDLGVNVEHQAFVEAVKEHRPSLWVSAAS